MKKKKKLICVSLMIMVFSALVSCGKNGKTYTSKNEARHNGQIEKKIVKKYETLEQKDQVEYDKDNLKKMKVKVIRDDLVNIENGIIRHDTLKLAFYIYSTLLRGYYVIY